jgi:hypothetical protein
VSLNRALAEGYHVLEIYEVYAWSEWTKDLFSSYMKEFIKLKVENSGWPADVTDKAEFIRHYREMEEVMLDEEAFRANPGCRAMAKLLLNSVSAS